MDRRILDFSSGDVALPEEFTAVTKKRMIYACGDAYGGFVKAGNYKQKTNIQAFSEIGFNIFCCVQKNSDNVAYLTSKPDLNVVLCIMTGDKTIDYPILEHLFPGMLELISTDDTRFYPSAKVAFTMLQDGGFCENLSRGYIIKGSLVGARVYSGDLQWGMPNFSIENIEKSRHIVTLKKVGKAFNATAKYANNIPNNTSHNENKARQLHWSLNPGIPMNNAGMAAHAAAAEKSWANWHTRRLLREKSKSGGKKKTRRNRRP